MSFLQFTNKQWLYTTDRKKQDKVGTYLELQFHGGDRLSRGDLGELLDVSVQVASWNLCVATCCSFQQGLVDEYVLIFCLHHVVPLSSHTRHVTVNVDRLLMFHPLQHGFNHNEAACPAHTSADGAQRGNPNFTHCTFETHSHGFTTPQKKWGKGFINSREGALCLKKTGLHSQILFLWYVWHKASQTSCVERIHKLHFWGFLCSSLVWYGYPDNLTVNCIEHF